MTNQDTKQELSIRWQNPTAIERNVETGCVEPFMLKELRRGLFLSQSEMGIKLAQAISPKREAFTNKYIGGLENGRYRITEEITAAFWNLAQALDHVPTGLGGAVTVTVLCQPGQVDDGAFVPMTAKVRTCAGQHCAVRFLQTHPSQKYHHKDCRK